jgi:alpha-L-arabinofuranosidase
MGKAVIPGAFFENPDGSQVKMNVDYFDKARKESYPAPGPFEGFNSGVQEIKVWSKGK